MLSSNRTKIITIISIVFLFIIIVFLWIYLKNYRNNSLTPSKNITNNQIIDTRDELIFDFQSQIPNYEIDKSSVNIKFISELLNTTGYPDKWYKFRIFGSSNKVPAKKITFIFVELNKLNEMEQKQLFDVVRNTEFLIQGTKTSYSSNDQHLIYYIYYNPIVFSIIGDSDKTDFVNKNEIAVRWSQDILRSFYRNSIEKNYSSQHEQDLQKIIEQIWGSDSKKAIFRINSEQKVGLWFNNVLNKIKQLVSRYNLINSAFAYCSNLFRCGENITYYDCQNNPGYNYQCSGSCSRCCGPSRTEYDCVPRIECEDCGIPDLCGERQCNNDSQQLCIESTWCPVCLIPGTECYWTFPQFSPIPGATPPAGGGSCDNSCGTCGFRKSDNSCTTDNGCCHRECNCEGQCVTKFGSGSNFCVSDSDCMCCVPNEPTGLIPTGDLCPTTSLTLDWNDVDQYRDKYAVRVNDTANGWDDDCSSVNQWDYCNDNVSNSTFPITVAEEHTYGWWVHAIHDCDDGTNSWSNSTVKTFRIQNDITPPTGLTPCATTYPYTTSQVTLNWNDVTDVDYYPLRVNDISNGWNSNCQPAEAGDYCLDVPVASGSQYTVNVQAGRTYGWWVHSWNECEYTDSTSCTFSVASRPSPTPTPTRSPSPSPTPTATPSTVSCTCTANPSSGLVPLNDVDVTVDASGSATGQITYTGNCGNGAIDFGPYRTSSDPYTISNICDYPSAGSYSIRVDIARGVANNTCYCGVTVLRPTPTPTPTFSFTCTANPATGTVPLNDVDVVMDASGTATGTISYQIDCTNDGTNEWTGTTTSDPYTQLDVCDYSTVGTKTIEVNGSRQGVSASDTCTVTVNPGTPVLTATEDCLAENDPVVNLSWTAATGATDYDLDRCVTSSCTWSRLIRTTDRFYTDESVTEGTQYSYRVRAYNSSSGLYGNYSNIKDITPDCGCNSTCVLESECSVLSYTCWNLTPDPDRCRNLICPTVVDCNCIPTPSPSPTRIPTPTPIRSPSPTPTRSPTPTPTQSPSPTPTPTPVPSCGLACSLDTQCTPIGLLCLSVGNCVGSSTCCRNDSCPTDTDCVCIPTPSPSPTRIPTPTPTRSPSPSPSPTPVPQCPFPTLSTGAIACAACPTCLVPVTWQWNAISGTMLYRIQIDNPAIPGTEINETTNTISYNSNLAVGTWSGRVRVETANPATCTAPSAWSNVVTIIISNCTGTVQARAVLIDDPAINDCTTIRSEDTELVNTSLTLTSSTYTNTQTQPDNTYVSWTVPTDSYTLTAVPPLADYTLQRYCYIRSSGGGGEGNAAALLPPSGSTLTWDVGFSYAQSWIQVQGGNVHSNQGIDLVLPSGADFITREEPTLPAGVITVVESVDFGSQVTPPEATDIGFLVTGDQQHPIPGGFTYYQYYLNQFPSRQTLTSGNNKPSCSGTDVCVYITANDLTVTGTWTIPQNESLVIFVPHDLFINTQIRVLEGGFLALIVGRNITVNSTVGRAAGTYVSDADRFNQANITGIFISDGTFTTQSSNRQLIAAGTYVAESFVLNRDLGLSNADFPGELFVYRPDLWTNAPNELKQIDIRWQEIAP